MTTVLITGATCFVGGLALRLTLADSRIDRVVALTRRPIETHAKLRNVVVDFPNPPADADWWNVDGVISALGTTRARTPSPGEYLAIDWDYPLAIAHLTRSHGATRFALVSSLGADPRSRFAYTRRKGELESELAALAFPSLTIVRRSALDGQRESAQLNERLAVAIPKSLAPVLPSLWRPSSATEMAKLLVEGAAAAWAGIAVKTNADVGSCST